MIMYVYYLKDDNSIDMLEVEVRETSKTYSRIGGKTFVRKENVNRAVAHGTIEYANRCFLTENNPDKAKEILIEQYRLYIEWTKNYYKDIVREGYKRLRIMKQSVI